MKLELPRELIFSKLRNTLSHQEEIDFNSWLLLENNRELFQQFEIVWENIQNVGANYEPDVEYYWLEISKRIQSSKSENSATDKLSDKSKYVSMKRLYRIVAAASVLIAITLSGAYYLGTTKTSHQNYTQTHSSLTGKSKVLLPDGTEVWLHLNSTLTYNSNLNSITREVNMEGEAYFNVTHDTKRPFIVHINGVQVKVHGTKFNVNSNSTSESVLVSLLEGSVSMNVSNKNVYLKPGEEGLYNKSDNTINVEVGDVDFAKSWSNDELRFENKNLRYVCRYLSKWYSVNINVDPNIKDNQSYTFMVRNDNLEEIMRIMERISSFDYQFDNNNNLTIKQKQ